MEEEKNKREEEMEGVTVTRQEKDTKRRKNMETQSCGDAQVLWDCGRND